MVVILSCCESACTVKAVCNSVQLCVQLSAGTVLQSQLIVILSNCGDNSVLEAQLEVFAILSAVRTVLYFPAVGVIDPDTVRAGYNSVSFGHIVLDRVRSVCNSVQLWV